MMRISTRRTWFRRLLVVAAPAIIAVASTSHAAPAIDAGEAPLPAALPDSNFEPADETEAEPGATATVVPTVTLGSVLKPGRLIWLFLVAIIVFTVSYGIQVIIWYRLRR